MTLNVYYAISLSFSILLFVVLVIAEKMLIIFNGGRTILESHVPHYGTKVGSNTVFPENAIIKRQPGNITRKKANKQLTAIGPLELVPKSVAIKHDVPVIIKLIHIHTINPNIKSS